MTNLKFMLAEQLPQAILEVGLLNCIEPYSNTPPQMFTANRKQAKMMTRLHNSDFGEFILEDVCTLAPIDVLGFLPLLSSDCGGIVSALL